MLTKTLLMLFLSRVRVRLHVNATGVHRRTHCRSLTNCVRCPQSIRPDGRRPHEVEARSGHPTGSVRPGRQATEGEGTRTMSKQVSIDPTLDFAIERFIDAPTLLVWAALTTPKHLKEWYMPRAWGRVARTEMDVRPGGIFSIDIATGDGQEVPNLGCFLDVIPMKRLVWTSMLFPGYRPAVFDDIPITAIITMESVGKGTRYVFTALHRNEGDLAANRTSGFYEGTMIAVDQLVAHVLGMK